MAQQIIHVPADHATIQSGINAAANGDTVLVAPGTYRESINFQGKAITVTSSDGPSITIIDGSQFPVVVTFGTFGVPETRASVLNGFTITNAGASMWPNNNPGVTFDGIIIGSGNLAGEGNPNPTITNNVITKNNGYGIEIASAGALISGNTISHTSTQYDPRLDFGCDYDDGDGIYLGGAPNDKSVTTTISNNTIEYNVGHCLGGGIGIYATTATITNNTIRYNQSLGDGGGIWDTAGSPIIQNLIYGNVAGGAGGGIYLGNAANLFIVNNTIVGNTISPNANISGDYVEGSQIAFNGSVTGTAFFNNIIVAGDTYAAIACNPNYQYLSPTPLLVDHSDILNFTGPEFGGWCVVPPTTTDAMLSVDPRFVASGKEPFRLQSGSPAIGAGSTSATSLPALDFDYNPRIQNGSVDNGVYEGAFAATNNPPPDFSMTAMPASLALHVAQSGTSTLTLTPVGGYIGVISLSCAQVPGNVSCSISPAGLVAAGDNLILNTTITVEPLTAGVGSSARDVDLRRSELLGCYGFTGVLLVIGARWRRRVLRLQSRLRFAASTLALLVTIGMSSCGGGSSSSGPPPPPPPNTYTFGIVAKATGNTANGTHSLDFTLTVSH